MIFHEYKFFNIDPPKTGATTVQYWLEEISGLPKNNTYKKHLTYKQQYSEQTKDYYTFGFVRNTWERWLSHYLANQQSLGHLTFAEFIEQHCQNKCGNSQLSWFVNHENQVVVDYIGNTNTLRQDIENITKQLDLPVIEIPQLNATKHDHYSKYYTPDLKAMLEQKYKTEIEYFGFKFEKNS